MPKVSIDADDLNAVLSLLDAYASKEKKGAHFKDNEQRLPDGRYSVIVERIRKALAGTS